MFGIFPEFGGLLQDAGRFYRNFRSKSKTPVGNHVRRHGNPCKAIATVYRWDFYLWDFGSSMVFAHFAA